MSRNVLLALCLAFTALTTSLAHAESRVVVRPFYGPQSDAVREQIEEILEKRQNVVVVSSKEADIAAKKLGADANSPEGRKVVAGDLRVSAWIEGIVQKRGNKLRLTVLVYDGANHDRVGRTVMTQRNSAALMAELKRQFWQKSKMAITRAAAPGESGGSSSDDGEDTAVAQADSEESGDDEEEEESDDSDDEEEVADATPAAESPVRSTSTATAFLPSFTPTLESQSQSRNDAVETDEGPKRRGEMLRASIGLGSPYRNLAYNDVVTQEIGDYQLSGAPMIDARVAYHPAAAFTDGWASWIGLDLRAQIALGIRTVDSDGNEFKSSYGTYHAGLLGRVPVGKHFIRAFAGYGIQKFTLESKSKNISSPTPNTDYRMLRAGAGGDLQFTDSLAMGLDAAWLQFLSVGQIGEWFPNTTAAGVEVGADLVYAVTPLFYARAFGTYQRVFFDFNSQEGDENIAGGATDNYVTVGLGAGIRL